MFPAPWFSIKVHEWEAFFFGDNFWLEMRVGKDDVWRHFRALLVSFWLFFRVTFGTFLGAKWHTFSLFLVFYAFLATRYFFCHCQPSCFLDAPSRQFIFLRHVFFAPLAILFCFFEGRHFFQWNGCEFDGENFKKYLCSDTWNLW